MHFLKYVSEYLKRIRRLTALQYFESRANISLFHQQVTDNEKNANKKMLI